MSLGFVSRFEPWRAEWRALQVELKLDRSSCLYSQGTRSVSQSKKRHWVQWFRDPETDRFSVFDPDIQNRKCTDLPFCKCCYCKYSAPIYLINLICELHDGRGDLWPIGLSLRPDVRLSNCWCGPDVTALPAQRCRGGGTTSLSVWLISVHWRRHGHWPLWFFGNYRLERKI